MVRLGLLEAIPKKGVIARILKTKEFFSLFEVAAGLKGIASRLASFSLTDEQAEIIMSKL
ncbi:MAG: DNA-binding GntR family transcriptional regulator [Colwellia sp.]|jgi:DNA-binding GntR family transcriptional regulator